MKRGHLRQRKKLIIDVDNINFVDKPEDLDPRIDAEINGLF
jgi:hypothetical protein